MNKWQKKYCDEYYKGKEPKTQSGKQEFNLLGQIREVVVVKFPESNGKPARTEKYTVTEDDCDIPNGKISVFVLASNVRLWLAKGYEVTTK